MARTPGLGTNPKADIMKALRYIGYPFAMIYSGITSLRNLAFDRGILNSYSPKVPTIAVGNLAMGGTGKTPMIEFLIEQFSDKKIAVVSRGYGRKTKGLLKVDPKGSANDFGDESLQIAQKYPVSVWVSEERKLGVQAAEAAGVELILLDDAFQHRYVKAHRYILLSTFNRPFFKDAVVPAGYLRESAAGAQRAQHLIFTKGPKNIPASQKQEYLAQANQYTDAEVYFTCLEYRNLSNQWGQILKPNSKIALITSIANTQVLKEHLKQSFQIEQHWEYGDHHAFNKSEIAQHLAKAKAENWALVCTDKDLVKLKHLVQEIDPELPIYNLPVYHAFAEEEKRSLLGDLGRLFSKG